jgi:hypothetical protein
LSNNELIADVYYILAGVSAGQGAVIFRNRLNITDIWRLDAAHGRWFEVETTGNPLLGSTTEPIPQTP